MGSGNEQQVYDDGTEGEEIRARASQVEALLDLINTIQEMKNDLDIAMELVFRIGRAIKDVRVVPVYDLEAVP